MITWVSSEHCGWSQHSPLFPWSCKLFCHIIVVILFVICVIIVILFVISLLPWSCKSFCHILLVSACHCCLIKGFFGKSMLNINMSNLFILSHYSFFQVVHYFLNPLIDVICENPAKIQLIVLHQLHG